MTAIEQQKAAHEFAERWEGKGYEKGQSQVFWIELLEQVFGVEKPSEFLSFEQQVKIDNTAFIDAYISKTKVMIEQKSIEKDLGAPIRQSDNNLLNPFQQAKRYSAELPYSKRPRWIVTCNFREFWVYDMEQPHGEPQKIELKNLGKEYYRMQFLVDEGNEHLKREMDVSVKAGTLVGVIYDKLLEQYIDKDAPETLRSLNILCVRLVFCLYAEDALLFGHKTAFHDYLAQYSAKDLRRALIDLFAVLDTPLNERDPYLEDSLKAFPYVNGGLFSADRRLIIPQFTEELKELLLAKASDDFDWSEISPTIFGAVFESTLNPETRRSGGMHYTSIENIHKVIDPLFLNDLNDELEDILHIPTERVQLSKLNAFQDKLASLTFFDPACGSGNFLTESYISLRRLENKVIALRNKGQIVMGDIDNPIKVDIHQFYGIEINDFAVSVATTALWIAEQQMLQETARLVQFNIEPFPLKAYHNIHEGNALRIDWADVIAPERLNYIMGNPPFVGARLMSDEQKQDIADIFTGVKGAGNIDYVGCWYVKAKELMKGTRIKAALVSTNSICQGEQTALIWKPLIEDGIRINFAYKTFRWDSESGLKAHVHCVIIGFSFEESKDKTIFLNEKQSVRAEHINPYLIDAPDIFIESRKKPLCNVKEMVFGSMPNDGGNFILSEEEIETFIKEEPSSQKYIKLFLGAEEFINNKKRYCLWLKNADPGDMRHMRLVAERVENVRKIRSESKRDATKKLADTPWLFGEIRQPESGTYLLVPRVSSEKRRYIPVGFLPCDVIASDATQIIPDAGLYEFGIMTSNVHNGWMRVVCGRLEMRYRYSANIVYNNFPWPNPTEEQKARIAETAQAILDARAKYPNSSLADLYDENYMPVELRRAHQENDRAVLAAYGFSTKITESACVAELFKMYQELTK